MPAAPRLLRSAAAVALAMSATSIAYAGSAAPARAAGQNGYCTSASGVTVVVDFRGLGGGIAIRCAPVKSGASGVDALQAAGIPVQGTRRYGLAFVCRIYGKPAASTTLPGGYREACGNTPPQDLHWDYFQASNGGSWGYSTAGPTSSRVIPGGFEGWSFTEGDKAEPGVRPVRGAPSSASSTPRSSGSSADSAVTDPTAAAGTTVANSNDLIKQSDKTSGLNATTVIGGVVLVVLVVGGAAVAIVRRRSPER